MNWREKIEAQIAELRGAARDGEEYGGHPKEDLLEWEAADTLQALLDVAVAAEKAVTPDDLGLLSQTALFALIAELDKLREVG